MAGISSMDRITTDHRFNPLEFQSLFERHHIFFNPDLIKRVYQKYNGLVERAPAFAFACLEYVAEHYKDFKDRFPLFAEGKLTQNPEEIMNYFGFILTVHPEYAVSILLVSLQDSINPSQSFEKQLLDFSFWLAQGYQYTADFPEKVIQSRREEILHGVAVFSDYMNDFIIKFRQLELIKNHPRTTQEEIKVFLTKVNDTELSFKFAFQALEEILRRKPIAKTDVVEAYLDIGIKNEEALEERILRRYYLDVIEYIHTLKNNLSSIRLLLSGFANFYGKQLTMENVEWQQNFEPKADDLFRRTQDEVNKRSLSSLGGVVRDDLRKLEEMAKPIRLNVDEEIRFILQNFFKDALLLITEKRNSIPIYYTYSAAQHIDRLPLNIYMPRNDLQQSLFNLLSNAMRHTDQGGIRVILSEEKCCAVIRVIDTGEGISSENLGKVFDKNFTTKRESGGTGLGLFLVRQRIEAAGGEVTAYSQGEGKGSTFTIRLPLLPAVEDKN